MPTILHIDGLRVVIYPSDHTPAHVHVIGEGCEAVFHLGASDGRVELRENYGFAARRIRAIRTALMRHREKLMEAWRHYHGE